VKPFITSLFAKYYYNYQVKEDEIKRACSVGLKGNGDTILMGKLENTRL
jgi:hypothetical protein